MKGESYSEGNYLAFMAITTVDSRDELSDLVDELGIHSKCEEVEDSKYEDVCLNKGEKNLQEVYDAVDTVFCPPFICMPYPEKSKKCYFLFMELREHSY